MRRCGARLSEQDETSRGGTAEVAVLPRVKGAGKESAQSSGVGAESTENDAALPIRTSTIAHQVLVSVFCEETPEGNDSCGQEPN